MGALTVEGLRAGYGAGPDVLHDVTLDVRPGEVVALLGASGSGKSTLLRCVAGLEPLRAGRILLGGADAAALPVERRDVGLVFQDHALFPHRDVAGNVAFGPRMQGLAPADIDARVDHALRRVGLAALADRPVDALSGGEQQRVALARALAARPRLLLLDEPYGSLDRPLREGLASALPALVRDEGVGALLVTHDQQEALRAADRIAVLAGGTVRQFDVPERLWRDPADATVATFLGVGPLFPATVTDGTAHTAVGTFPVATAADGPARLLVPTAALHVDPHPDGPRLDATVVDVRFAGDAHRLEVRSGEHTFAVRTTTADALPAPGGTVTLGVDPRALRVLPVDDGPRAGSQTGQRAEPRAGQ